MSKRQRLRYRFDNLMSRGLGAKIALLGVMALVLVGIAVFAMLVFGAAAVDENGKPDSLGMMAWRSLTHTLDPGTLGNDAVGTNWPFLFVMLFVTIGGVFVVSSLIGVLSSGFGETLDQLRRGKSTVIEHDHTVILGWTPKIYTLVRELAAANAHHRDACIVILAERDKVEMDHEIGVTLRGRHKIRVVTRTGTPMVLTDFAMTSPGTCRSIIVLAPERHEDGSPMESHESDTIVLKTLLAIKKIAPEQAPHVVAEVFEASTERVARFIVGDKAGLIHANPQICRVLVQTGRQSGLSAVYTHLLGFDGADPYMHLEPKVLGMTFRDAVFEYDTSSLIGVSTASGEVLVPPPLDRVFAAGDEVVTISHDDESIIADGGRARLPIDASAIIASAPSHVHPAERTLVLGASRRTANVVHQLDIHCGPGSEIALVGEDESRMPTAAARIRVTARVGDLTNRALLDELDVTSYDHVLVLSETHGRTQEMADARTTVILLHLRDIERLAGKRVPITTEILDIANRDLASVADADDFIVSNRLVSLLVAQLAQNPRLVRVLDELFSTGGHEIYLKPAGHFVAPTEVTFATVCEAALRREEVAIGYRLAATAGDESKGYGVVLDPAKRSRIKLGPGDQVIVLATD